MDTSQMEYCVVYQIYNEHKPVRMIRVRRSRLVLIREFSRVKTDMAKDGTKFIIFYVGGLADCLQYRQKYLGL